MTVLSPRVRYWRAKRVQGKPLFAAACASEAEARLTLPLAPDLILYHPGFSAAPPGDSGMLSALESFGNANEEASRGLPAMPPLCAPCPVAMGVCGTDPFLLTGPAFASWRKAGLEGVANFPTIGLVDGSFRADLEASGSGLGREIECLRAAHQAGFFTAAFACKPEDAALFAAIGCDVLILHLGLDGEGRPRSFAKARAEILPAYISSLLGRPLSDPSVLLHGDHLITAEDEAAWKEGEPEEGLHGLFAAGGAARVKAVAALFNLP